MPQISLYIDEDTLKKVEDAAKKSHVSISKWVAEEIRERLEPTYPYDYETLFGSIGDGTFTPLNEYYASSDVPKETL